uniref:Uncharacterized protein n=1 Tax=Magallana gigas TaxID=29159 RepID=K1QZ94_MAGGI
MRFVERRKVKVKIMSSVFQAFLRNGPQVLWRSEQSLQTGHNRHCPDGYYGINCSRQCRYPNYGKHCQQDCSHCNREMCNSTVGCRTQNGTIDRESQNMIQGLNLPLVIGVFVGVAAVIVIAVLLVISFANRRFYSRQIRENAYYVGSVVSEHVTTTLCRVPEKRSDICDENIPTDNNTYMLASSLRYENM